MSTPGRLPLHEYVASRQRGRKPPNIEGITVHAQQRAKERLPMVVGYSNPTPTITTVLDLVPG